MQKLLGNKTFWKSHLEKTKTTIQKDFCPHRYRHLKLFKITQGRERKRQSPRPTS